MCLSVHKKIKPPGSFSCHLFEQITCFEVCDGFGHLAVILKWLIKQNVFFLSDPSVHFVSLILKMLIA